MWILLVLLSTFSSTFSGANKKSCGGVYTAARGVLSTPNFPGPFKVPINCEWVIDAQLSSAANTSIVVYLTQLFVYEGLTFTEYQIYGDDYKINPKIIHTVNETNISRTRWIKTYQSFLVIQLKLSSADSVHLRVLDKFLDVFGFNITYEITTGSVRSNSCTMMDCGFTGNCYDYYTKFSCSCLQGYSGPTCSNGSNSFCDPGGVRTCKNGGRCIHVGVAAVRCACTSNFTGPTCDTPVISETTPDCSSCRICPSDDRFEAQCKCVNKDSVNISNISKGDVTGFTTTIHLTNLHNFSDEETKHYLKEQILRFLQRNYSFVEDIVIKNIVHFRSGTDVTFHVSSLRKDEKMLQLILNKLEGIGHVGNMTIPQKEFYSRTQLSIQSLDINKPGLIREEDQFILSCVARGSPTINFRWFKDGISINVTATRKWLKLIKDPHVADQYTGLLGIERAHPFDEGIFTCQVEDFGLKECLSKRVVLEKIPLVKIEPFSLTVKKGENFTIKCITADESKDGTKYIYSWTKNKELLPVRTEFEKYEVLFPSGSILQVRRADKNAEYSCLVQGSKVSSEKVVSVYVVDRKGVNTCRMRIQLEMTWPETAADTISIINCPKGYTGFATRYCALKDKNKPVWEMPSFSDCTHHQLGHIYEKFQRLKLGYVSTSLEKVLNSLLSHVQTVKLLPGEGAKVLNIIQEMVQYTAALKLSSYESRNITNNLFLIIDKVLSTPESLNQQTDIRSAFEVIKEQISILGTSLLGSMSPSVRISVNTIDMTIVNLTHYRTNKYFHIPNNLDKSLTSVPNSVIVRDIQIKSVEEVIERFSDKYIYRVSIHPNELTNDYLIGAVKGGVLKELNRVIQQIDSCSYKKWLGVQISAMNILSNDATIRFAAGVVFRNISSYMPPRLFLRDRDGSEIEYEIYSHIVTIFPLPELFDMYPIAIDFKHQPNQKLNKSADETWGVKCGYADMSTFTYSWNIYSCYKEALNDMRTRCICPKHGIFALLLTLTPKSKTEESLPTVLILVIGCALGIVFTFIAIICLAISNFLKRKSSIIILKLQCSISVFVFEVVFTAAILLEPTQKYFLLILAGLEASMLLGLSSHLSKLLMIFTELIELPKSMTSKQTVIGIISGVPVITVFASHLSYKTMDVKLESWWILQGTLSFNIFICVTLMMALLFAFIYTIVMKKLDNLMKINEKYAKPLLRRKRLLRRSCYIFTFLILFSISSIIYMNNPNKLWSVFQFSTINVLVGLVILICYVLKSETRLQQLFVNKKKTDNIFFSINSSISSPLKFITKQDAEIENDSTPQTRQETQQFTLVSRESTKSSIVVKSQNIAATFESCLQNNPACDSHLDKIVSSNRFKQPASLEHYNSSPQGSRRYSASSTLCSPDILSNKVCVELDLVASSIQCQPNRNIFSTSIPSLSPDKTITSLLDYHIEAHVPARGTETSYKERTQPDGHDESIICEKNLSTVEEVSETETDSPEVSENLLSPENLKCKNTSTNSGNTAVKSDNLDGMLDSISQDLEYLLNNSEDVNISSIKSASKGPASLRQVISNVVDDDNRDNITIRSKC